MSDISSISNVGSNPNSSPDGAFATLASRVYTTLHEEITAGRLEPGTRLVRRLLSKRLGVSPIPVTEALFRLEQDGLVESEAMFGARVKVWTLEAVRNDLALREALECQTARLAAVKSSPDVQHALMTKAEQLDAMMHGLEGESSSGMYAHMDYHLAVAAASGMAILQVELRRVWMRRLMRWCWLSAEVVPVPADWHRGLTQAIGTGDPAVAEEAMRVHVQFGQEHELEVLMKATKGRPQ